MINNSLKKTGKEFSLVTDIPDPVTNASMVKAIAGLAGVQADTYAEQLAGLQEMGIATEEIMSHMGAEQDTPMAAEAIMLTANLYLYYMGL